MGSNWMFIAYQLTVITRINALKEFYSEVSSKESFAILGILGLGTSKVETLLQGNASSILFDLDFDTFDSH